ncbi:MAG TPA: nitrate/nitrite transporter [Xanthobacteraceae bacterium]|jgi:NNP family nitrate/nitrite transporter-like MFS transporter
MHAVTAVSPREQRRALWISTIAFTVCFAVWTIFSIIGVRIAKDLGLSDTQFGLLVGTPILSGAITRVGLGIWTDRYGGRLVQTIVMLAAGISTLLLSTTTSYLPMLAAALGVGIAGGSFAVGVAYISRWYPTESQGTALGLFGLGNVGASLTHFAAPYVMVAFGWPVAARIWAGVLMVTALVYWFVAREDPVTAAQRAGTARPSSLAKALAPLRKLQVWRFSLYYFFTFGAFVALSLWLPRYYVGVYGLSIETAGLVVTAFSLAGSVFRAFGGWLSDRHGARSVMYLSLIAAVIITFIISYPETDYVVHGIEGDIRFTMGIGFVPFVMLTVVLGFFMSLGSAAVYKHIPVYYPDNVGSVGGLVGMIGALGGFVLPIAFGFMNDLLNVWTSCFMLLFSLVATALIWMHAAIRIMERRKIPELRGPKYLPELEETTA